MSVWSALLCVVMMAGFVPALLAETATTQKDVERWGIFELSLSGPTGGNPFEDVMLSARFVTDNKAVEVRGFYDGSGTYRIRFMPDATGRWSYETKSNQPELAGKTGNFVCVGPTTNNHGPVRVQNTYHFAYADETPYVPIGTTCYGWVHEPAAREDQTLASLRASPFNKVRMCLIPTRGKTVAYPYPKDSAGVFDHSRFDVGFFQNLERRIGQLRDTGIEADLILFHPYNKGAMQWFDQLDNATDDEYLRYAIARLGAYRNVWWSLANEYGQVKGKTDADWDHFFQLVMAEDPYGHLRSIHNAAKIYDANKSWVTHASIQNGSAVADFGRAVLIRELCRKPVVYDEVCYEGNINRRWGQLSGEEMVQRFWFGTIAGTYVGHGEALPAENGASWIGQGGKLLGTSPPRISFLKDILIAGPATGIEPIDETYETHFGGKAGSYYLVYFGNERPTNWRFWLPRNPPDKTALAEGIEFRVDVIDTWNMTISPVKGTFTTGKLQGAVFHAVPDARIDLPGKPYLALRIQRVVK